MTGSNPREMAYDVVVVGGGAAGVGVAVALRDAGVDDFLVVERHTVGASFASWPAETCFITPSFPSNSIGMLDLNSIAIGSSPAHILQVEHPTGTEYSLYLRAAARFFELPVRQHTDVMQIAKVGKTFRLETNLAVLRAKHVVWAVGEFQYPRLNGFGGSELCRHTATIPNYRFLEGEDFIVIGGYESGVDAAYNLAQRNKGVRLIDRGCPWDSTSSDPSVALSTYSLQRMRDERFAKNVELLPYAPVSSVKRSGRGYEVTARDGRRFYTSVPPLLAVGFEGGHAGVAHLFEQRDDGFPLLTKSDESTIVPGVFLCGPAVRHGNHVFCFVYKYRQRFAVVAKAIATSLKLPAERLETYRAWGMYLDDLSCCGHECMC